MTRAFRGLLATICRFTGGHSYYCIEMATDTRRGLMWCWKCRKFEYWD